MPNGRARKPCIPPCPAVTRPWGDSVSNPEIRDFLLGLASAAFAALCARLVEIIRRRRIRARTTRMYPIEGVYVSTYTDTTGSGTRTVRDMVHINQMGSKFAGHSQDLRTGRQFTFEGEIKNESHLAGTYRGERREDGASGVFYMILELLNTGYIKGVWAGYNAESASIDSGSWNWRKVLPINILDCEPQNSQLPNAVALLNDALGSGFVKLEELQDLSSAPDGWVLAAKGDNGRLQGVATASVMTDSAKQALKDKMLAAGARPSNLMDTKVGILKSIAVAPGSRRKGIGYRLVMEQLSRLNSTGCSSVVALSWESGSADSSLGVLEAAGFNRMATIREYWREPEGQETFDCIRCGQPCECTAIAVRRSLYDFSDSILRSYPQ